MKTELPNELTRTAAGATADRVLRSCVHCGMCNATCPTYQLIGDELDGPRGRIYLLKQALEGQSVSAITQQHIDRCLGCRACETTCPSGVEYHKLYDIGRDLLEQRIGRPRAERLKRWGIQRIVPFPNRLRRALTWSRLLRSALPAGWRAKIVAPSPPEAAIPARHPRRMILLKGCVQSVIAGHFNAATRRVLDAVDISLIDAPQAQCCGALNYHLGEPESARDFARRNIDAWWPLIEVGAEAVIVNASGCGVFLQEYADLLREDPRYAAKAERLAGLVRDPVEILLEQTPVAVRRPGGPRIVVHEPCTLQHGLRLSGRVATLLGRLGYDPQPVRDAHLCCGSAGAYSLLQPEIAASLRAAKLQALTEHEPAAIYTANIGCWMHLRETAGVPVHHWIEAVDEVARATSSQDTVASA